MSKILVVDDEDDLREMIGFMLRKEGYEIEEASDGNDFLNKLDKFKPNLVTLDVMMPGLTTREIFEQLPEKQHKPQIIMLTVVRFSENEKEKLFSLANVVDYIYKPFEIDEFLSTVKKHM
jgi:two-component system, OmpR family, alkaline phosphatase synthesis response regulator PhoP